MEQNSQNQNKNEGLFQKNQIFIAVGVVIVLAAIVFFATRDGGTQTAGDNDEQEESQVAGEQTQDDNDSSSDTNSSSETLSGNVSVVGQLKTSDDTTKGNLMVVGDSGKIYVATKRDFGSLVGQDVTLNAEGTLNQFTFLGFGGVEADMGGAPDEDQTPVTPTETDVTFTGKLQKSNNASKGNYIIVSGKTIVYLQTAHDHDHWIGQDVVLTAVGTLDSFTQAVVVKK